MQLGPEHPLELHSPASQLDLVQAQVANTLRKQESLGDKDARKLLGDPARPFWAGDISGITPVPWCFAEGRALVFPCSCCCTLYFQVGSSS